VSWLYVFIQATDRLQHKIAFSIVCMSFGFRYIRQYSQKKQKTKYFLYYLFIIFYAVEICQRNVSHHK
jgi:hypothetical protein